MELLRQDTVRCKIIVNNNRLKKRNHFKYLGCGICYKNKERYLTKTSRICSNTGNSKQYVHMKFDLQIFKNKSIYNALVVPISLYGREIWALGKKDKKRVTSI